MESSARPRLSSFGNDTYTDGKSFMQSRGAAFFAAGGVSLGAPGGGTGGVTRIALPGRIQAEDYRSGGPGVGYHDLTAGNSGGAYRTGDVDIQATADAGGGFNVGWIAAGEWLAYDVQVARTGTYSLTLRMASAETGAKTATVSLDGVKAATFSFAGGSGWQSWKSVTVTNVKLAAGDHVLRISMANPNFNVNWLDVTAQ